MKALLAAAPCCALTVLASAATAADMSCVWARLPAEKKEIFFSSPPAEAGQKLSSVLSEEELGRIAVACGYENLYEAEGDAPVLVLISRREHSERWLAEHDQITPDRLSSAWDTLGPESKRLARQSVSSGDAFPDHVTQEFAEKLQLASRLSRDSELALVLYLFTRASR